MAAEAEAEIALAFVGNAVPQRPEYLTTAFSPAGNLCQQSLLSGLREAGLPPSLVLSLPPVPSFRGRGRLWFGRGSDRLEDGTPVRLLPFVNVTPLKQLSAGLSCVAELALWGARHRGRRRVVYCYNVSVPPGLFLWGAARLTGSKIVGMIYDVNVPGESVPATIAWRLDFWQQRAVLPRLDALVVISDEVSRDLAPGVPALRVEGGLACGAAPPEGGAQEASAGFTVMAAGSLTRTNGFDLLLEAFALVDDPRLRLRIAGRGPLEGRVREAAARDPRIEYLGFLPVAEVVALYREAQLLLNLRRVRTMNTRYFFPSKMMEYLASGVPVLSTSIPHLEEEYAEYTYLLREESPQALAAELSRLAALPPRTLRQRGARAREFMLEKKSWRAQAARIAQFLRRL